MIAACCQIDAASAAPPEAAFRAPQRCGRRRVTPRAAVFIRRLIFLTLAVTLAGCAARPGSETLDPVAVSRAGANDITVFAVTDRTSTGTPPAFGGGRGALSYEQFTMQAARPATIGKTGVSALARESDPSKDFITVRRQELDRASFNDSVNRMRKVDSGNVVVFVHGYNYSYQEAVFRLAQLSAETGAQGVPVLFSWPSQADVRGYIADRDSTTYARDDLVQLLTMLCHSRSNGRVVVIGHSMGAWLVMEALRQLRLQGQGDVIERLQVGLASPDIDVDVFRAQVAVVGRLSPPLTVLISNDDRALALSRRLTGGKARLGAAKVGDPEIQEIAARSGVQIIDITTLPSNDAFNHDRFVTFATRYATAERVRAAGGFRQAGVFLLDTTGRILSAPFSGTARVIAGNQ